MIIRVRTCRSRDIRQRFEYLLWGRDPEKCFVYERDMPEECFARLIDQIPRKEKYWSVIVSFHPRDRLKFLEHLPEIVDDLREEFFRGYPKGQRPGWHVVVHLDGGNPHLHITIANDVDGRAVRWWYHKRDLQWLNSVQTYLRAKYNLTDPRSPYHAETLHEDRSRARREALARLERRAQFDEEARRKLQEIRTRDELRRKVNELAERAYLEGLVADREELIRHFEELGLKVPRRGRDYITVSLTTSTGKEIRVRLRGSIYGQGFRLSSGGQGEAKQDVEWLRKKVEETGAARFSDFARRFGREKSNPDTDRSGISPLVSARVQRGAVGWDAAPSLALTCRAGVSRPSGRDVDSDKSSPPLIYPFRPYLTRVWWWKMWDRVLRWMMPFCPQIYIPGWGRRTLSPELLPHLRRLGGLLELGGARYSLLNLDDLERALRALQEMRQTGREQSVRGEGLLDRLVRAEQEARAEAERARKQEPRRGSSLAPRPTLSGPGLAPGV